MYLIVWFLFKVLNRVCLYKTTVYFVFIFPGNNNVVLCRYLDSRMGSICMGHTDFFFKNFILFNLIYYNFIVFCTLIFIVLIIYYYFAFIWHKSKLCKISMLAEMNF